MLIFGKPPALQPKLQAHNAAKGKRGVGQGFITPPTGAGADEQTPAAGGAQLGERSWDPLGP